SGQTYTALSVEKGKFSAFSQDAQQLLADADSATQVIDAKGSDSFQVLMTRICT
ncbi:hypothetical protein MGSAQ_002866, partial [marine sediment metagenome]